jgi:uncharacterized phage protein gp47/JayE
MAQTPDIKTQEQFLGEMLADWISRTGVNDINVGSLTTQLFEVMALMAARVSGDALQILRDLSVDRAEGESLRRIATDEGLRELPARVASGTVTITDSSFTKIATKIYAGAKAPNIGSTEIFVSDASNFPNSGNIYIGRGTPNVEGPLAYTSKTPIGGYWKLTLSTSTTKFHNINESVILAQGGTRSIPTGTVVRAPASGATADVNFVVTQPAVILDGETEVNGVLVSAQEPGKIGNVPIGAIKEFATPPFTGAKVTNKLPFKTGRDVETDEELRIRIKRARLSRGLGTALAVKSSVIGATPSDENATIVSSEIVTSAGETTLYVDDGTGYEQKTSGVGVEFLVDSALGGETNFQLETGGRQTSVAKAFIVSNLKAPFDIAGTDRLAVSVGGVTTEHVFQDSDFISPGGATAYEIVASINANSSLLFEAATAEGGTKVMLQARANDNEDIQVVGVTAGRDAAVLMGFPSNKVETLRLFKNKKPLSKDGRTATVISRKQTAWSSTIASGETLKISVDGTDPITYTITDADFIAEGSHNSVAATNSLESWVNVFNNKLTGVTATRVGEQIYLTSNLGTSDRAKIEIFQSGSSLVSKGMFSSTLGLSATGKSADFEFSRNTAQIKLKTPLNAGDELTAGSRETEARVQTARILGGTLTIPSTAYIWFLFDDKNASIVNTGVSANSVINVQKPTTNIVRYVSSVPSAFSSVQVGDYVIIWSTQLSAPNRLEGRVNAVTPTALDIKVTAAEYAAAVVESGVVFQEGFVVLRTSKVPQKLKVNPGTAKPISQIADELSSQVKAAEFSTLDDEIIVCKSKTKTSDGAVLVVTFDVNGKLLSFTAGDSDVSKDSLIAFYESGYKEGSFPLFAHTDFASEASAVPPSTYISTITSSISPSSLGLDPNLIIGYLQPYGSILDALSTSETTELDNYSGATLTLDQDPLIKRLRLGDRLYFAQPLDFGHEDEAVVILDGDVSNKTFEIPFFRRAQTNTSLPNNPNSFNAYDLDGGPTTPFTQFFGSAFKFDNFKVLMQAKRVIDPPANEDAILYRAVKWGRSGERINVAYTYPTVPNSPVSHTVTVDDNINVRISLKSGGAITTNIDGTTEWDVTITPNTPVAGVDQVTYTWSGVGTAPGLSGLSGGEYVTISQGSELNVKNTGTFRVSTQVGFTPTANSFTIVRKNGEAVAEQNKATLVASVFSFYAPLATTAADIQTYVSTSSLSNILTATLVNDSGTSGSGVINKSTAEQNNFAISYYFLKDGINWIASTNLGGSPQFTFKTPLTYTSDTGYAFNQSEELRLIPTSVEQAVRFANVLAVTGFTTLGSIRLTNRESRMELSTNLLGGSGSIQIVGGTANSVETPVLGSSLLIKNQYILSSVNKSGLLGFHSDQWVKLFARFKQPKSTLFKETATISIDGDFGTIGKSKIALSGRTLTDRHFGQPRHHIRSRTRTFKVEKQGDFTCISWDGSGTQPFFSKTLNLNATAGGTLNIEKISNTSEVNIFILTGPVNFTEVSIGDIITISGMVYPENNGSFLVTGVSQNGKTLRILNPIGISEFSTGTFTITNNATVNNDQFQVGTTTLIAGTHFTVGATANDTAANLATAIGAIPGVTASASANVVTIEATTPNANIALGYTDVGSNGGATVSGSQLVGRSYTSSDFSCTSSVKEGDTVIISAPFTYDNRGKFRVIRRFNNSIYIDNPNSVEETVNLPNNYQNLGYALGVAQFKVDASNNRMRLQWISGGTEPDFDIAQPGDELICSGTNFLTSNQGTFTVTSSGKQLQEITRVTCIPGNQITSGHYWLLNAAGNTTEYYVWYNVSGGGGDPMLAGKTGIQVVINSGDSASQVATATNTAINGLPTVFTSVVSNNKVTITTTGYAETTHATTGNMNSPFSVEILQAGRRTFIECINPSVTAQSTPFTISNASDLLLHRPQILFYEYEATVKGDSFIITGDFLGSNNKGSWVVDRVIDQDTILVVGSMVDKDPISLSGHQEDILVQEESPYVGYKQIRMLLNDPASPSRGIMVFSTPEQFNKINDIGQVQIYAMAKLGFNTTIKKGLDSYRYHTGLIGEANRIVYGDPRDPITYPGVGAAGAEIFIREPLFRRVQVAIDVRIETGIPFAQIAEQVRTNITALIEGNEIGQPIAISDIVETVNTIPGVRAVAISSPLYNASNDTIHIAPSEKARIIDPTTDISVRQIGS